MVAKYGLLIGVTYPGTDAYLPGCDNDILEIYKFLKQRGYHEFDVLCDTDVFSGICDVTAPGVHNIVQSFFKMIAWAKSNPNGHIFLHYSGHGTQIADSNMVFDDTKKIWSKEEEDGKDECIVTQDLQLISDDQLRWIFSQIPSSVKLFSLMDSCHSGSAFDLKYYMKNANESTTITTVPDMQADIFMISGCRDDQYGQSCVFGSKWYGVMTYAFLYLMNYMTQYGVEECSLSDVWKYMGMICSNFPQIPQASCSKNEFNSTKLKCNKSEFEFQRVVTPVPSSATTNNTTTSATTRNRTNTKVNNVRVVKRQNTNYIMNSYSRKKWNKNNRWCM